MKATTRKNAWNIVNDLFPTDYIMDEVKSTAAGYPVYVSTAANNNGWISDLGTRLEVNMDNGETVNVWIDDSPAAVEQEQEQEAPAAITAENEMTITLPRVNVIDIKMALASIAMDLENEARNPEISEERREIATRSAAKWWKLREELNRQQKAQEERTR